jgi:hypothetical protein
MTTSDIFWLALPAILGAALCVYLGLRQAFDLRADEDSWTGTGFDANQVAPRLRRLRADYVTEVRGLPAHTCQQRVSLALARQGVARRSFFQRSPVGVQDADHNSHES